MHTEQSERVRLAETLGSAPRDVYPLRRLAPPCRMCEGDGVVLANASVYSTSPVEIVPCPTCSPRPAA